jgi:hypothetical protein
MKIVVKILYVGVLAVLLVFPLYIKQLEPLVLTESGNLVERGLLWGPYGYVRMLVYAFITTLCLTVWTGIVSGKTENEHPSN